MNEITCTRCRELFVDALYRSLSAEDEPLFTAHLRSCEACSKEYAALQQTLRLMDGRVHPEPPVSEAAYWDAYWQKLSAKIESIQEESPQREAPRKAKIFMMRRSTAWIYASAAVLFVGIGIFIGRIYFGGAPVAEETISQNRPAGESRGAPAVRTVIDERASAYLERSKVLLLGVVNATDGAEGTGSTGFGKKQQLSRSLLKEAANLKGELSGAQYKRVEQLISDLEVILLQLANIESQYDVPAIEMVRRGIDQKALLLKINLEEMRAADAQAPSSGPHQPSKPGL